MKKTCYVTTPIYYASGDVHIGNSYSTIVCDTFARFHRLLGDDVFFLTGMDEHGLKIEQAATKQNKTPQQLVDELANKTKQLWHDLDITNTDFIRTSDKRHEVLVQKVFEKMLANDDIYLSQYEGDYCVSCEAYFTKSKLEKEGICPDCGKPLTKVQEESYFLRLSKYSDQLLDFIEKNPDFIQPISRRNEVVAFIKQGLEDLCASRTSFSWGIPVLSNPKHVVYVWIDALFNYLSALGYDTDDDHLYNKFWKNGDVVAHVVGKDILRFHAIYWPIMLMAMDIPINFKLYVHGWILMKEGKMSKSVGNIVYPRDVVERYGLDALRYFLVREMPLGNDAIFSYDRFIEKFNSDLVNDLGNLLSRSLAMADKYFNGLVKKPSKLYQFDSELETVFNETISGWKDSFQNFRFQNGLNHVWNLISRANKYIDETTPWILAKDEDKKEQLNAVLYHLFEVLRCVAVMISPVMNASALKILGDLGKDTLSDNILSIEQVAYGLVEQYQVTKQTEQLFKRLDVDAELAYHESKKVKPLVLKPEITIDDFTKMDLRVGQVIEACKMEKSDKLLILKVKIENEVRQIVSGIANFYSPEEMVGKKVVVVANLKPVKLRGHLSEGMILCASTKKDGEETLEVLEILKEGIFAKVN